MRYYSFKSRSFKPNSEGVTDSLNKIVVSTETPELLMPDVVVPLHLFACLTLAGIEYGK